MQLELCQQGGPTCRAAMWVETSWRAASSRLGESIEDGGQFTVPRSGLRWLSEEPYLSVFFFFRPQKKGVVVMIYGQGGGEGGLCVAPQTCDLCALLAGHWLGRPGVLTSWEPRQVGPPARHLAQPVELGRTFQTLSELSARFPRFQVPHSKAALPVADFRLRSSVAPHQRARSICLLDRLSISPKGGMDQRG